MDFTINIYIHTQRERYRNSREDLYLLIYRSSILIAEELLTYKQRGKRLKPETKERRNKKCKEKKKRSPSTAYQQVYTEYRSISQCMLKTNYLCLAQVFLPLCYEIFVLHFHRSTQIIIYNLN